MKKIHTIERKPLTGQDAFGKDTHGATVTFEGRWNKEVKEFLTDTGAQLVSVGTIYYEPPDVLVVGDLVRKQNEGEFQPVRAIAEYPNGSGSKQVNIGYLTANVRQ